MELDKPQVNDAIGDDTPIWRYMDLPKFASMLVTGGLWFTKAARLHNDPYEVFSKAVRREIPNDEHGPDRLMGPRLQRGTQISVERMVAEISCVAVDCFDNAPDNVYVNSWCLASESMA